ncbi:hypothetical protein COT78_00200 [Candidatus Berkelbacteria bacterium CG10_big_fil_rev_8_21_14_0_10_43_13]|uniref:Type II secretion system protein GspG C-terminal domain-containing protein n=1 Tax=Candidatus Berkelbacteria bacterium CG10_big_fil_rev_8_21_14_0_10_43_13 TaxID=1974514 RepID=A0A2H0W7I5_9BACT|nr:MAG: hypothetical protein COT78_00200 [Candidatus Berkelbacteria bacterium CG10_big_fil_rev_8_21_14_0_10_43_13]
MKRNKRGQTLIEALVIIAIVAILAAILWPVGTALCNKVRIKGVVSTAEKNNLIRALQVGNRPEVSLGELVFVSESYRPHEDGTGYGVFLRVNNEYGDFVSYTFTYLSEIEMSDIDRLISGLLSHYNGDTKLLRSKLGYDQKDEKPAEKAGTATETPPDP